MRTEYKAHITIDGVYLEHVECSREKAMLWLAEQSERAAACSLPIAGIGLSAPRYFSDITGLEMRKYGEKDLVSWSASKETQPAGT